jgi:hypothetical protein
LVELLAGGVLEGMELDLVDDRLVLEVGNREDLLNVADTEVRHTDALSETLVLDLLEDLPGGLWRERLKMIRGEGQARREGSAGRNALQ